VAYPSTFLDIQNQVIAKLRLDSTADLQRVKDYINRAYAETCVETEALQTFATMNTTEDVRSYTLPVAIVRIKQMTLTPSAGSPSRPLIPVSLEQILEWSANTSDTSGQTTHYAINGLTELVVWPTPNSSDDVITVWYVKQPTALSANTDVPALPEPYATRCLENGACYEAALFAKDPDAQIYRSEYEVAKGHLRGQLRRLQGAMTQQFRITRGDMLVPHDPSTDVRWSYR
jgi:hypothetical protein